MKLSTIYIISWFGERDNPTLRDKRKLYHQRQLEWARKNDLKIVVYAQDYDEDEYESDVTYVKNTGDLLPPGHARNKLLELYYETDDDFAMFADNDVALYDQEHHKDSSRWTQCLRDMDIGDLKDVGLISPWNPARNAFSDELKKPEYDTHYTFHRHAKVGGGIMWIKNINKHLGKKVWFDEVIFGRDEGGKLLPGEDSDFSFQLWKMGQGSYQTVHALMCEWGRANSTWIEEDHARYQKHVDWFVPTMNDKHGVVYILSHGSTDVFKGFNYYGISRSPDGIKRLRFCRFRKSRIAKLTAAGHTEIEFHELPEPMMIPDMFPFLIASDLYKTDPDFKAGVDKISGKKTGRGMKLKTFVNWPNLNPHDLPKKIEIPK